MHSNIQRIDSHEVYKIVKLFSDYRGFYGMNSDPYEERFLMDRIVNNQSVIFVAYESSGDACGFCQCYFGFSSLSCSKNLILNDLYVDIKSRGLGYGKTLIKHVLDYARNEGYHHVTLETEINNKIAINLYRELGFESDERFMIMHRNINKDDVKLS
ncbi:GNAT family N-acetyltransferase [Aeromonas caviae]